MPDLKDYLQNYFKLEKQYLDFFSIQVTECKAHKQCIHVFTAKKLSDS